MTAIAIKDLPRITDAAPEALDESVKELFTYHAWSVEQIEKGQKVKNALAEAYKAILLNVPSSPSRTRALNCLTDARMLANASISFNGEV